MKNELTNVMSIEGVPNMIAMNKGDHEKLYGSIVDVQLANEMLEKAKLDGDIKMIKITMEFYIKSVKEHKVLWSDLLNKYVGVDYASHYKDIYKYDTQRKVIFLYKHEGCTLCEKGC